MIAAAAGCLLAAAACRDGLPTAIDDGGGECAGRYCDAALLSALGKDTFYTKILVTGEIPIISSWRVADRALEVAAATVDSVLTARHDVRQAMVELGAYVGVMDDTEVTTDIPEHAHLANDPVTDWDTRARGLGGTPLNPITTVGEENLLCLPGDVYVGESILIHEFAHSIHLIGINTLEPGFTSELEMVYDSAIADGLWADTYAGTNPIEYWAEGAQSWFDADQQPQAGIHNHVDTRAELLEYDPRLHDLLARYFPATDWSPECPAG